MAGHSHWTQIKRQKAITDAKRSKLFSKAIKIIAVAARDGSDPNFNPKLKSALEKAKEINLPKENIEKAIKRGIGRAEGAGLEEVLYEAYGPGGVALILVGITDNRNRASQEIKHILQENGAKMVPPGSVSFLFEKIEGEFRPRNPMSGIASEDKEKLKKIFEALDEHEDIQEIYSNLAEDIGY
ncbi:MAG: hypothetical protein A3H02_02210 [Candidatus Niyogibacteria bacterium RIFCSPLOWO2_12_FULL_41_13]|uniref:Transcriptional regulatory protein n=1 Tax=Candidatus Niyogibacteria bacterium RIFCSPLOWO2_12_FULL_41_13 TaxID=1801726 RepID=A0A1G2F3Y7_9BACT|nr:MAG: hypothetical protein A3H02_02210 [Candidatus Niyogibacteria bacterium RIFCSPLOWO2_12_FULL_41_13]